MITWLASYPRSGNTFVRTLLKAGLGADSCSVYNDADIGGNAALAAVTGHQALPNRIYDEAFDIAGLRAGAEPVFLKTHEITPALVEPDDRVIYIVRDGREATLSHARYERDIMHREVTARELIMGVHFPGGSWADHVRNWNPAGRDDTLLVRFEQLIAEPVMVLEQLSAFTGLPLRSRDIPRFAELQDIDARFFRAGRGDSYREEMPEDEQTLFWLRSHREMRSMGYHDHVPAWLEALDAGTLDHIASALQQAAVDLKRRQSLRDQAAEAHAAQIQAHVNYRDRLVRSLRQELEPQTRELELLRAQTFQLQDELAFYYKAFVARDEDLENFLAPDPQLRLARLARGES